MQKRIFQEMCVCVCVHMLSHVQLFATPWTVACQASLSIQYLLFEKTGAEAEDPILCPILWPPNLKSWPWC